MSFGNIINKTHCICGGKLKKIINFGKLPLINLFKNNRTPKYPTIVTECSNCKLIQLQKSVRDKLIYPKNYLYKTGDSADAIEDFKELIQKIKKKFKDKYLNIVDVGGNDGTLMLIAKKSGFKVLNIEPTNAADISKKKGINTLKKKFSYNTVSQINKRRKRYDILVSTNFFGHINNLDEIILSSKKILKESGIIILELQYINKIIQNNGFDSFHQDHKYYYSINSLEKLLNKFDLYIFDVEFCKKHNEIFRAYVSQIKNKKTQRLIKLFKKENKIDVFNKLKKLNTFRKTHTKKLSKLIKDIVLKNQTIYGIGASPRGCVLLNSCNLSRHDIKNVGEVPGSDKINKLIPGTNIPICSENKIISDQPDYVLILAWHFQKRLVRMLKKKGFKGNFILPLPKIKILN